MLKKKFKITGLLMFFSLLLVLSTSVSANAKTNSAAPDLTSYIACEDIKGEVRYIRDETGKIVKKETKVSNVEEYAKKKGLKLPSPNAEILHISPVIDTEIHNEASQTDSFKTLWIGDLYIKNVQGPREGCDSDEIIRLSYYDYPGGKMSISESVQASYGGSVSVSAEIVSAAVNFNVTQSFGVSDTQDINVPYGKKAQVTARPVVFIWQYDIYKKGIFSDSFEGTGWAQKPKGVCYDVVLYDK